MRRRWRIALPRLVLDNARPPFPSPDSMPHRNSIAVSARQHASGPTLEQERFSYLLAEIEKTRHLHGQTEARFTQFRRELSEKLAPLRTSLRTACRESVFAIDRLLDQPGWLQVDRHALRDMLRANAEALLESNQGDADIKAIYDKHESVSFDSAKQEELERLKQHAEEIGFDLGDADSIRDEEDLVQRIYAEMAAREREGQEIPDPRERRRKSAAQSRAEDSAQRAKQALRELYRKLASAVHPDREHDAALREEKNALMQKINQAYANNDLMSLFEAQMQIERIDSGQISRLSAERLKQYNKLLAEQLGALKQKLRDLETSFCMDLGLPQHGGITPAKLSRLLREQARALRAEIARQQHLLDLLANKTAMKRWLKQQRRFARGEFDFDDPDEW